MTRRPYTTKARFFSDSDAELDIVWYPCTADAKDMPFDSAIYPLDFSQTPWMPLYPGEVWDRFGRPYNGREPIPRAGVGGVCGTPEDFANGNSYTDPRPPTKYRSDGLPTCCPVPLQGKGGGHAGGAGVAEIVAITEVHPDPFCPDGPVLALDQTYRIVLDPETNGYVRWEGLTVGEVYRLEVDSITGPVNLMTMFNTTAPCSAPLGWASEDVFGVGCHTLPALIQASCPLLVSLGAPFTPGDVVVRLSLGAC